MAVTAVTAGGGATTVQLEKLYEIINILGKRDLRCLLPLWETDPADGEDVQDIGQRGHHFSPMNTGGFDNDPYVLGDLLAYRLNGADEGLDLADHDDFSMGADGTAPNEPAFSLVAAVRAETNSNNTGIAKYDVTALAEQREYRLYISGDDYRFGVYDEANDALKMRRSNNDVMIDEWTIIIGTYDGSTTVDGLKIFVDGVRFDTVEGVDDPAYVALNNTTAGISVGYFTGGGGVPSDLFTGDIALPAVTARRLTDGGVGEDEAVAPFSDVARLTNLYREVLEI